MSLAPAETVLEHPETAPPPNTPTAHLWHIKCQGKDPGPKVCYCGARITISRRASTWTGKAAAEDCVVCIDLHEADLCPICGKGPTP